MNWFKKLFAEIEDSSEENEEKIENKEKTTSNFNENLEVNETSENSGNTTQIIPEEIPIAEEEIEEIKPKVKVEKPLDESIKNSDEKIKSAIDLEEFTISKIILDSPLAFSGVKLSGISIHFRNGRTAPEVVAGQKIFENNTQFLNKLYRELSAHGIGYTDNLKIKLIYNSTRIDQVAQINKNIGIEVFTPQQTAEKFEGVLKIQEGYAWENEYKIEPIPGKIYYIGRGKNPKLDNARRINNDIAFISLEEKNDEKYKINNYVSRSIAQIYYDEEKNVFVIKRSPLMNNMQHIIKVYSLSLSGFNEISLTNTSMQHILKDRDEIVFNEKISLQFSKILIG